MKTWRYAPLTALLLTGCHTGASNHSTAFQARGIHVVGEGRAWAAPDMGTFTVAVETLKPSVAEARDVAAGALQSVLLAVKGLGVASEDVQTQSVSIAPQYDYTEQGSVLKGYRAFSSLSVRVLDLDKLGAIIDAAAAAAGDLARIEGPTLELEDPEPVRSQARKLALENARARAEQIAATTQLTLGAPIYVEESSGGFVEPGPRFGMMAKAAEATPIERGQNEIRVNVSVTYAIE
jgi:uncharacterized protein YggE